MKKQFLVFVIACIPVAFFSCKKENAELNVTKPNTVEEQTAERSNSNLITKDPLLNKLDGWYTFNRNLKDVTGKLPSGVPVGEPAIYTNDHKGTANAALKLDGLYMVKLSNIPQQTPASVSVWVKTADLSQNSGIVSGNTEGLSIFQNPDKYIAGITLVYSAGSVSTGIIKDVFNLAWHHLVVTYDGATFKYYVDAVLVSSGNFPGTIHTVLMNYFVGNGYWKGAVDELRFYSRALSATDVQKLYNL